MSRVMLFVYRKRSPWLVLVGAMLVYTTLSGTFFYAFGVFLPVMTDDLGWSRSAMSGGLSLSLIMYGLSSPLISVSIRKYGPRVNIIMGSVLAAAGLLLTAQCHEIWHFYLFFGMMVGLGTAFGHYLACITIVNNWFFRKRGLAIGLLVSCGGIAGFIFPPLTSWLIEISGWRTAWLMFGVLNVTIAIVIGGLLLIRDRSANSGYSEIESGMSAKDPINSAQHDVKTKPIKLYALMTVPTFWFIIVIGAANLFGLGSVNAHQVAFLTDMGFSAIISAMTYSIVSVMNVLGRVGMGFLSVHVNLNKLVIIAFILQICSFIIVLTAKSPALIYFYSILFGTTCGAIWVSTPVLVTKYFGHQRFAIVMGWVLPVCVVTESIGAFVTGAIHDRNLTYTPAFWVMLAFAIIGLVATLLLNSKKVKNTS